MANCIDIQEAIDAVTSWLNIARRPINHSKYNEGEIDAYETAALSELKKIPSVQPEIEERMSETEQNVPNDDFISRKRAIDAIEAVFPVAPMKSEYAQGIACGAALSKTYIEQLPSVQSEIIRCKDCKWFGKAGCAVEIVDDSDKPTEDDYCSFAERRTDE